MNCAKIGLPGKSIVGDYFQENRTSQRPFLLVRISFPGRPIFIQFIPGGVDAEPLALSEVARVERPDHDLVLEAGVPRVGARTAWNGDRTLLHASAFPRVSHWPSSLSSSRMKRSKLLYDLRNIDLYCRNK